LLAYGSEPTAHRGGDRGEGDDFLFMLLLFGKWGSVSGS